MHLCSTAHCQFDNADILFVHGLLWLLDDDEEHCDDGDDDDGDDDDDDNEDDDDDGNDATYGDNTRTKAHIT